MEKFKVWRRVKRSEAKGHKLLTSKWVHKRKTNERGEVNRFKARLVARGFTQAEYDSFHPDEVFAHVVDRNSLRTVLSMAASQDLKLYSFDISNAYLQAELKEGFIWHHHHHDNSNPISTHPSSLFHTYSRESK